MTREEDYLRRQAVHGFGGNANRRRAWSVLLLGTSDWHALPYSQHPHARGKYTLQIDKDLNRALYSIDTSRALHRNQRKVMRRHMRVLLNALCSNGSIHYVQGLHDIAEVLLHVTHSVKLSSLLLTRLCEVHFHDIVGPDLLPLLQTLEQVYPIVQRHDPELYKFLMQSGMSQPHFAVPWLITWFAHGMEDMESILRVYDFLIGSSPDMPVYLCAALVLYRSKELQACPCDMGDLHGLLQHLPHPLPLTQLFQHAITLRTPTLPYYTIAIVVLLGSISIQVYYNL